MNDSNERCPIYCISESAFIKVPLADISLSSKHWASVPEVIMQQVHSLSTEQVGSVRLPLHTPQLHITILTLILDTVLKLFKRFIYYSTH